MLTSSPLHEDVAKLLTFIFGSISRILEKCGIREKTPAPKTDRQSRKAHLSEDLRRAVLAPALPPPGTHDPLRHQFVLEPLTRLHNISDVRTIGFADLNFAARLKVLLTDRQLTVLPAGPLIGVTEEAVREKPAGKRICAQR
ncbi:hypothetical protein H2203_002205 [Taxawa tesnikishii (nom. ined.)]|nr:hypothetical protein H2203_002205 [Dothideales sp. JES 119]